MLKLKEKLKVLKKAVNELKNVLSQNKETKKAFFYIAISSLVINFLALATPLIILQTYDRILPNNATETLSIMIIGVSVFLLFEILLKRARNYVTNWSSVTFDHNKTTEAIKIILRSRFSDFESRRRSEYLKKIDSIKKLTQFYSGNSIISLVDLPFSALFLFLIYYIGKEIALIPIVLITIFFIISYYNGNKLKEKITEKESIEDDSSAFTRDTLKNIKGIKALGLEKKFLRSFESQEYNYDQADFKLNYDNMKVNDTFYIFSQIMTISIVSLGALKAVNGEIGIGSLAACSILSNRIMLPIQKALTLYSKFQEFLVSKSYLNKLYSMQSKSTENFNIKFKNVGLIRIENLTNLLADGGQSAIFNDLSLSIKRGESIAFTPPNNLTKKSLFEFILGVVSPFKGRIYIDNIFIDHIPQEKLPELIAYLPQKGQVFKGSIWDNLSFFDSTDEEDVKKAAVKLGIDEDVVKLPEGYHTQLTGKYDDVISEGLKQRIAIARAIAKKPRIILYDNADATLDRREYNYLYSLLGKLKHKTAMVIYSEDRNLLSLADKFYKIKNGSLELTNLKEGLSNIDLRLGKKNAV